MARSREVGIGGGYIPRLKDGEGRGGEKKREGPWNRPEGRAVRIRGRDSLSREGKMLVFIYMFYGWLLTGMYTAALLLGALMRHMVRSCERGSVALFAPNFVLRLLCGFDEVMAVGDVILQTSKLGLSVE